jgi:flagellar basal-body rod protein FlgF/flagellar basal-body rod protein FlgG
MAVGLLPVLSQGANVDSGFYAACAGLRAQSQALEVVAHNLANLNTAGFRGQQTTFQTLVAMSGPTAPNGLGNGPGNVLSNVPNNVLNAATNNFAVLEGTRLDMTAGSLEATGNPLDVGIEGSGFFAVQTAGGTRYTRNGSFQVNSKGVLVTAAGDPVLGDPALGPNAVIDVPPGKVSIASDGTLSVNGVVAGTIQPFEFAPGTRLTSEGGTLFAAPEGSAKPAQQSTLRQGALESSNVNSIGAVVTLIGVQRQAEMMQRAMSLFDTEFNQIASNSLPKV